MTEEKYLTMKEVAECFKQLDFNEIDAANISFYYPIYCKYTYIMENDKLELCCQLFHQNPKEWVTDTEFYAQETIIREDSSVNDMKKININQLRIKDDENFRKEVTAILSKQDEISKELIKFVKTCCSCLKGALNHVEIENNNFRNNKITLGVAAALLTTWLFLNKKCAILLQPKQSEPQHNNNKIKIQEKEEEKKKQEILEKLEKDLELKGNDKYIKINVFIKWLKNNSNNYPLLTGDIAKYYQSLLNWDNLCNSVKNTFIAHVLLHLVYQVLESVKNINSYSSSSIIDTELTNNIAYDTSPYSERVIKFANNFSPKSLISLAKETNTEPLELFQKIVANKIRWFVQIDGANIYNQAGKQRGWAQGWPNIDNKQQVKIQGERPKPKCSEEKRIEEALRLAPFYKLAERDHLFGRETNFETALKNKSKAVIKKGYTHILELPEELYFLVVHYDYRVEMPCTKESDFTKLAKNKITLKDVVLPECEAQRLKVLDESTQRTDKPANENKGYKKHHDLHKLLWTIYVDLKNKLKTEPSANEVWDALEKDYEQCRNDPQRTKYNKQDIVQEIKHRKIYWITRRGEERNPMRFGRFKNVISEFRTGKKKFN